MTTLDLDFVRAQFPAFTEPALAGWAFFENAGGSYPARQVVDRLSYFYGRCKVQPYAPYPASEEAGAMMDESYARIAAMLNVAEDEVHFGPSTSQNTYVLAHAFRARMADGDEVVVTNQDHEANSGAWRRLADTGIVVREWKVDPETGHLNPDDLDPLLSDKTRIVAFPHASNIVAEINPVAQICKKVRQSGAVSVVDGVSYAPHGLPDIAALGADIYLFSSYKTYGPHQGVMAVRREIADRLPNESHWFNAAHIRKKLVPAGPDHAQIAALAGIAHYTDAVHDHHFADRPGAAERARRVHDLFRAQEQRLTAPLIDYLKARNDVRVLGPTDPARRAPTVAIAHARPGEDLARALAPHRIMAGGGDFYAVRLIEALGIDPDHGVLRLSFLHYTAPSEVERAIAALDRVLSET
ncbi:aminotransferase class V-fold PLP-dependent enzyme [Limibaculum sp. M0105]|uniref:Aminotransferase class V-fold PLP-dependent enzyme n=1 Tax=Thermohalobaculum xanthum TaxID=2753746 RepID=A0A8J7M5X8_9RHOB|nr:aminotransferase class V-fold PLP-dependent enzyme [Thermohalobaculum xanthum]MBK0398703.1 aminotransferase class V-fold PLP-dependent enzyme [Thermohalobaculum xanthum]